MNRLVLPSIGFLCGVVGNAHDAAACNEDNVVRVVNGVAANGTLVYTDSNSALATVEIGVVAADGKRIAWCESSGALWQCHGDATFTARAEQSESSVRTTWLKRMAADGQLTVIDAPIGIVEAMCARVPDFWGGTEPHSCNSSNATMLASPLSPLIFVRFHVPPFAFCGATSSADMTFWVQREQLAKRLRNRVAVFAKRKAIQLEHSAAEAIMWLQSNPQATTDIIKPGAHDASL
jgi:hypothetical protein